MLGNMKGFSTNGMSDKSSQALQSETWQKVRKTVKEEVLHFTYAPEIQHFAMVKISPNDNVYGIKWGNLVREYLKTAYAREEASADVVYDGIAYKALKREKVTVFYDADGNTLFDVENKRLEKEYGYVMKELNLDGGSVDKVPDRDAVLESPAGVKGEAKAKLEDELKVAKDKSFAEPVIRYLIERCGESESLAQDVMQAHKKWERCIDYIYRQAKKQAKGNNVAIRDAVVFEWAEDYYHKDDKEESEKKAKEEAERKAKVLQNKARTPVRKLETKGKQNLKADHSPMKKEVKPEPQSKQKKSGNGMEGQIDMFSMFGM